MVVNFILFDDFETMDAFGPAQIFGAAPEHFCLNYYSAAGGIVNSRQGVKVWTEKLEPEKLEGILVVPGGRGARKVLYLEENTLNLFREAAARSEICMMVAAGSSLIAQTGLLFRRKAADYAHDENWKRMFTAGVSRVADVRWVADGKFYSCSCTAAALDMALGVVSDTVDIAVAERIAGEMGYPFDPESEEGILW